MKRGSEDRAREALNQMDLDTWVYKPPDDARNWKPADFIVWYREGVLDDPRSAFLEVKDVDTIRVFNPREIRPAQRNAILRAAELNIPYLVAVWWRRRGIWTISRGIRLVEAKGSLTFVQMSSSHGIEATLPMFPPTLRMVLVEGVL